MKSSKRIIIELFLGLFMGGIFVYLVLSEPSEKELRNTLKQKGFNQHQIDSIIQKNDDDF